MDTFCVYMHTNKINGKKYIGQTCLKTERRWNNGKGYKSCPHFYRAIQKYGWDNFKHEILYDHLEREEANHIEEILIAKYNTINIQYGYNLKSGGENNFLLEETKRKISETMKEKYCGENNPMYGKHHSEETKIKLSEINKDKHLSEETRRKMSENHADFKGENHPMYGKHHSKKTRKKMSESHKGKNHPNYGKYGSKSSNHKSVYCVELDKIWSSIKECAEELELDASAITKVCKEKYKTCGGYHFQYGK